MNDLETGVPAQTAIPVFAWEKDDENSILHRAAVDADLNVSVAKSRLRYATDIKEAIWYKYNRLFPRPMPAEDKLEERFNVGVGMGFVLGGLVTLCTAMIMGGFGSNILCFKT
jgi:hypothetical protein